ncbi:hypothetical protein ACFLTX_00805 [Chloroflexota bacterium]
MIIEPKQIKQIESELIKAEKALQEGNAGQSRVCARRAAGLAIRGYLQQVKRTNPNESFLELLQSFTNLNDLPADIRKSANNLSMQVSKSFGLPKGVDLIEDAQEIIKYLSNLTSKKEHED